VSILLSKSVAQHADCWMTGWCKTMMVRMKCDAVQCNAMHGDGMVLAVVVHKEEQRDPPTKALVRSPHGTFTNTPTTNSTTYSCLRSSSGNTCLLMPLPHVQPKSPTKPLPQIGQSRIPMHLPQIRLWHLPIPLPLLPVQP
jgi:hypothetical protein